MPTMLTSTQTPSVATEHSCANHVNVHTGSVRSQRAPICGRSKWIHDLFFFHMQFGLPKETINSIVPDRQGEYQVAATVSRLQEATGLCAEVCLAFLAKINKVGRWLSFITRHAPEKNPQ